MLQSTYSIQDLTNEYIRREDQFGAHNYKPLPVVLSRGKGVKVWDVEGKEYYDCLSAYSALNQGHCHPRLLAVMEEQMQKLTLTSRAFYNDKLGVAEEFLAKRFGYDKTLFMNSGAEGVESAIKLARRWGYVVKGIPDGQAVIVVASNNFHGRTTGVIALSTDRSSRDKFGPYMGGIYVVPFDDPIALETALENNNVCAFLVEPIQGEAGVVVPEAGYLKKAEEICRRRNVLLITDEIQTGLGRTGRMLCQEYDQVKADILILGKALSGGMMPISAVLCNDSIMLTINPGEHGSTFGGNPLAAAIAVEAVKILDEEGLVQNALAMGEIFRKRLRDADLPMVRRIRGKGLFNAVQIIDKDNENAAGDVCMEMMHRGLLAKQTHGSIIRFAPPLMINEAQVHECCDIIIAAVRKYAGRYS
jgi:ornithine--oxo-acid transaminase